jgi:hypothetical protein
MKRKRHPDDQIIAVLRKQEVGMKTADVCRKQQKRTRIHDDTD